MLHIFFTEFDAIEVGRYRLQQLNSIIVSGFAVVQLPLPFLPLSFTPSLITVILSTINSLSLNYLVSSRSRTLLLVLSLKLCPVISLP